MAAANGFVVGAAKGALAGSGAGILTAFATDFVAGSIGDALEQGISTGKVNLGKSLLGGAENALCQMLYGTGELTSAKNAFRRGVKTGAVSSGFRNIEEALWPERSRDPKRMCGSPNPFDLTDGVGNGRGYHGATSHGGVSPHVHQPQRNIAPDGKVYGVVRHKTADEGVIYPRNTDIKQLYEYLNNDKYQ